MICLNKDRRESIKKLFPNTTPFYLVTAFIVAFNIQNTYAQYRIMPLGNSLTMGRHGEPAGYRDDLATLLLADGVNFVMVGSVNDGTGFYPYHEGHSGQEAGEIDVYVDYWLNLNPADIVLLHIGTNDISHEIPIETAIQDIESIIDKIRNKNSQTKILLCSLVPRWEYWVDRPERTDQLNELILQLYNEKKDQGYKIYFVDQADAFYSNPNWTQEYMDDYAHPNDTGYHVMAQTFYDVLSSILNISPQQYSITGTTLYYANNNPISNVRLNLSGGANSSVLSNSNGNYTFSNLESNLTYLVTPTKDKIERYENTVVTMYDAALTLRHAVGVENLSNHAQIAADVDKDGQVIAYDAAMIARYVVELDALENDHVGEWVFSPDSRYYQNLSSDKSGENYTGILLGDASGTWSMNNNLLKMNYEWQTEINAEFEKIISVPITIFEDSLLSLFVELEFPKSLIKFESIATNSVSENNMIYSLLDNKLKLGAYFAYPQKAAGRFLTINFKATGEKSGRSEIQLKNMQINNYQANQSVAYVNITPGEKDLQHFTVSDNYPNPFNPATTIPYKITKAGNVKIVIYNMLGRQIKTILNEKQKPGAYEINWDGKNDAELNVANGTYIYRVFFNSQIFSKTMIKIN
ncbi:T9SS type A sorting domain-containing protein [candidate division KSB1 bacterium]|nr:T9SS type A sorting domain-containing protein [candidate division KSB1 bacterium]